MPTRYSDIDLDFIPHPATHDLSRKIDVEAVRRSVRNLVNFNFYEKPFHPEIGSGVRQLLFEPVGDLTAIQLQNAISETIRNFEPRVDLSSVTVTPDNTEENYYVAIQFNIKNVAQPYQIDTTLQRLR